MLHLLLLQYLVGIIYALIVLKPRKLLHLEIDMSLLVCGSMHALGSFATLTSLMLLRPPFVQVIKPPPVNCIAYN